MYASTTAIHPQLMEDCIREMVKISKNTMSSQMKPYLERKNEEIEAMQYRVEQLKEEISKIERTLFVAEQNFAARKKKIDITLAELEWYSNIKTELEKECIPVDHISFLTRTITTIKKYSSKDMFSLLQKINEAENIDKEIESKRQLKNSLDIEIARTNKLDQEYSYVLSSKILQLELLEEIEMLGFNIKEFQILIKVLNQIALENGYKISPVQIRKRFFGILSQYRYHTSMEKENERLQLLKDELERKILKNKSVLVSQASIGNILKNLLNKGYHENQIIKAIKLIDEMEKSNLKLNDLTNSLNHIEKSKTQPMIKVNKEFNITIPLPLTIKE